MSEFHEVLERLEQAKRRFDAAIKLLDAEVRRSEQETRRIENFVNQICMNLHAENLRREPAMKNIVLPERATVRGVAVNSEGQFSPQFNGDKNNG